MSVHDLLCSASIRGPHGTLVALLALCIYGLGAAAGVWADPLHFIILIAFIPECLELVDALNLEPRIQCPKLSTLNSPSPKTLLRRQDVNLHQPVGNTNLAPLDRPIRPPAAIKHQPARPRHIIAVGALRAPLALTRRNLRIPNPAHLDATLPVANHALRPRSAFAREIIQTRRCVVGLSCHVSLAWLGSPGRGLCSRLPGPSSGRS